MLLSPAYLWTGQRTCHDVTGQQIPCKGSGQDAELAPGLRWPKPRWTVDGEVVLDELTGLTWLRNANATGWPMTWDEALEMTARMRRQQAYGFDDWRLPNRKELRSLMSHQTRDPSLPEDHPFVDVFLGWYWTATSLAANPAYAWYVHLEGARTFYGAKDESRLVWPLRGSGERVLPQTGQTKCYDAAGRLIQCAGSWQDGELRTGAGWPSPRFVADEVGVRDRLTGLVWSRSADLTGGEVTWQQALDAVGDLERQEPRGWRLPTINELESLVDLSEFEPALPAGHPFEMVQTEYWSSTTSLYEPDWAWALYLRRGVVGVGQKKGAYFRVWPVCDEARVA